MSVCSRCYCTDNEAHSYSECFPIDLRSVEREPTMFGEDFMRDFLGMPPVYNRAGLEANFGRETIEKAMELAKGQPPEANIMPYIQLVMDARKLGLEIVRPVEAMPLAGENEHCPHGIVWLNGVPQGDGWRIIRIPWYRRLWWRICNMGRPGY